MCQSRQRASEKVIQKEHRMCSFLSDQSKTYWDQRLKRPPDKVCINTICKEAEKESSKKSDENEVYCGTHDFDEMTAEASNDIEDNGTGNIGTHKDIERRGQINQCNLIEAPFVESNIILNDDIYDCTGETNDQMPSSPQLAVNLNNFPSIIEIVKGSILYNISDVSQDSDSGITLQSIPDAARQANLDKKQHQEFQIICCTFMISWLGKLYMKENHRQVVGVILDGITRQLSSDYKEVTKILINHGASCNLFFFLSGTVSGSAAALLGGGIIHAAAGLNRGKIPQEMLCKIKGVCDVYYGGAPTVLTGDFHLLSPCGGILVYKNFWSECWHGSVNCCIF
eukprot:15367198-Ditylum_brightwellii.AAC.4